ncbi:MAG: aminotransferase class I/II-fold pyridoxal phosphate-dependent enzyme [Cryobacterium sp.]|uniref:aminotransferase-like domain-containing protein n=1 Tax=unclassified Cryobacterium TaxID=2649013 RepID=UPI0018CBAC66|nr:MULTISPECIES: aminotransferase class I/II-fold pyridoxal phosphate-dependent enzyme [unclassified Cryobacterium]MCY7404658.1 aminotransferase class I/II-fold pyridoxal phosphate-dependent enzyme [Cryobacterium sp.]MEC5154984.1 DNA-binding transcriptional MocR family regulator [Cryobacterium sp. CAN_C3]
MPNFIDEIEQRTPAGIAAAIGRLIASGRLTPGDRLPTVRVLAGELGVSPATVSHAWQALSAVGLIVSRGRGGTFVQDAAPKWLPARSQSMIGTVGPARLDLSRGTPDPLLLPALGPALSRVSQRAVTPSYQDLPIIPELLKALRASWPYPVETITIVDGALDAISRSLDAVTRFGDRVIMENPSFPPFFDLLDQLGLERLPVAVDEHGIIPADFAAALKLGPAAVLLQPRAQNPTGASMTANRAEELARLLRNTSASADTIVIEDDHSAEISIAPDVSLGLWLPGRTLHVRSFSKSHGPDLRMAALGGPAALIDPIVSRRMLGPGWTSRMLQTILHDLLTNGESMAQVSEARRIYFARQRALADALTAFGLDVVQADGINTWLPVQNERDAMVRLAASGIRVAGGSPFLATEGGPAFIRVTAGALTDNVRPVAEALAAAAHPLDSTVHAVGARWS